jgi:hypothetical protein
MDLSNYVDVPTRFAMALERWPELRIVENRPEIITIGDKVFIAVTVQAWRTPDDQIPAQNTAWEIFPGVRNDERQHQRPRSCLGFYDVVWPENG